MAEKKDSRDTFLIPCLSDFVFVTMFFSAFVSGARMLSIDSDLGRHLALGSYILDHHIIPSYDLFSYTLLHHPRPPYEWLSQIFFALANRLLGLDGVIVLTAIVIAATFTLVFQFANSRSKLPILVLLTTLLAAGASSLHWLPRPHIVTFLLLGVWIENLEQLRKGKLTQIFVFPLLMLLWVNLHGGFIFGILVWAAYMGGWLWEKWQGKARSQTGVALLQTGLLSLLATVVTPNFWHNWEAVLNNRSTFILDRTAETLPPDLMAPAVLPFSLLLALTPIVFLAGRKTLSASHLFLLAGLGYMALSMVRNIPLFAIACAPVLCEAVSPLLIRSKAWTSIEERFAGFNKRSSWPIFPLVAVLCTVGYLANKNFNEHRPVFQFDPQTFPVQALNWLETNPQSGKMFNEFNWGGYLLYRSWPRQLVFLDSQSDFYGEALMRDYEQVMTTRKDWKPLLPKYQIDWAIIQPGEPLAKALQAEMNWTVVYHDNTTVILHKP